MMKTYQLRGTAKMSKVVYYMRVSTEDLEEQEHSIEDLEDMINIFTNDEENLILEENING